MGYDMYTTGEKNAYHRLNIWGMAECRNAMHKLGMLNDSATCPDFPEWKEEMTDEEMEQVNEAANEVRDFEPTPITGIPTYKLCSNDGWHVTGDEIEEALRHHDSVGREQVMAAVPPQFVPVFDEWIEYLRLAKDEGGFSVY